MAADLQRKLTTILAADAEGFSRAMGADEAHTVVELRAARDVFSRFIDRHHGRIANTAGDGLIAEFPSVVEAVQCAVEVQNELGTAERRDRDALKFRIGIHLGDVIVDGHDLLGDGVNLAARLQSMAEPGGVLISRQVYDQVHAKLTVGFEYLGEKRPKNLAEDVSVYRIAMGQPTSAAGKVFQAVLHRAEAKLPKSDVDTHVDVAQRSLKQIARPYAIASGAILATDLMTGVGFWAHWPILALAVVCGWHAAPSVSIKGWDTNGLRVAVLGGAVVLINVFTWTGRPWSIWPVLLLAGFEVLRRKRARADA